jgi:hypothetical protein
MCRFQSKFELDRRGTEPKLRNENGNLEFPDYFDLRDFHKHPMIAIHKLIIALPQEQMEKSVLERRNGIQGDIAFCCIDVVATAREIDRTSKTSI